MPKINRILVIVFFAVSFAGCQTSLVQDFEKISPGMSKDEVLSAVGPPRSSGRMHGRDRWIYRFYENQSKQEKEVHFLDGRAVYIGGPWVTEKPRQAETKDLNNSQHNTLVDQKIEEEKAAARKAYDNYIKESRGEGKVKYLPKFTPIE